MERSLPQSAAVVRVHYSQFDREENLAFQRMECRTLCWCKSGSGEICVNGTPYHLTVGDYLFLPWGHAIEYHADAHDPFFLGSIHLVPLCATNRPIENYVAHFPGDTLSDCPWRKDALLPGIEDVVTGTFERNGALEHLAEFTVHRLLYGGRNDSVARQLAHLLLREIYHSLETAEPDLQGLPPELRALLSHIRNHLERAISLNELSNISGLSRATVGRLFRKHLRCSPGEWIIQRRMDEAKRYLCTTRLSVWRVGCKVGIEDQFYFSKLFKKLCGVSPLAYRKTRGII